MEETGVQGARRPDVPGGLLAGAFLLLLLASEAMLTLPDERAPASSVATFYAANRLLVLVLQTVGFLAAGLLAAYSLRLHRVDRAVGAAGLVLAAAACLPGIVTALLALVANPAAPEAAARLNGLEPRADDVLFLAVLGLAATAFLRLRARSRGLAALSAATVGTCLARLLGEAAGGSGGLIASLAPICFLLLVGWLGAMSLRGTLPTARRRRDRDEARRGGGRRGPARRDKHRGMRARQGPGPAR